MFAVVVTFLVKPGAMATFLPAMLENARASRAEPACQRFDVCTDPERPNEVFLYEIYDDAAGFAAHGETPHYAVFSETVGALIAGKDVRTFSQVEV